MGVEKELLRAGTGAKPFTAPVLGKMVICLRSSGAQRTLGRRLSPSNGQGSVIKGWDEGVMGMQLGESRLRCSPDYAYGANGFPTWGIEPNSVLIFEIELLKLE